jgi:hypothetical protein
MPDFNAIILALSCASFIVNFILAVIHHRQSGTIKNHINTMLKLLTEPEPQQEDRSLNEPVIQPTPNSADEYVRPYQHRALYIP